MAVCRIAYETQLQGWFLESYAIHYQCHIPSMIITRILLVLRSRVNVRE
jgi:hypothetical protein